MNLKKSVKIFGKVVPIWLLVSLLTVGIGSAAVLTYYGTITASATVQQSILLDGKDVNTGSLSIADQISESAPGGEEFCAIHVLKNQMSVSGKVKLDTSYNPTLQGSEITTTYDSVVTDNAANPITDFGLSKNEVCGEQSVSLTLDEVFAGDGFKYGYTVLTGGTYNGASPIVAVLELADGRYVVLFPGWGDRTGSHSLQFSDTVATSTADSGSVPVDFTIYNSTWNRVWSSSAQYGNWNFLKASGSSTGGPLPLTGSEVVVKISIQHQAANTGEQDRLDSLSFDSQQFKFVQPVEDTSFDIASKDSASFCLCHAFAVNIAPGVYGITTQVVPQ
jgi:hypothetical protein